MKKALERTIQTLIDSGGDPWEYDSKDINTLVNWIEKQRKNVSADPSGNEKAEQKEVVHNIPEVEINNYIDFEKLFSDLYREDEDNIIDNHIENPDLGLIMQFNAAHKGEFELMIEECEINDKEIIFVYTYDYDDANESDNRSTTADYVIIYDRITREFSGAEFNQG